MTAQEISRVIITILVENTAGGMGTIGEHGFSALIELTYENGEQKKIVFDTGASGFALRQNLTTLHKDLRDLDGIVLSHGHWDHVWGLPGILPLERQNVPLFCHPAALETKWRMDDHGQQQILSIEKSIALDELAQQVDIRTSRESVEIVPGVVTTGEIPRENDYETLSGGLRRIRKKDAEHGEVMDTLVDDLSLIIRLADASVVIVTGCCHAGIVNTMRHVATMMDLHQVRGLIGGLHLVDASQTRLDFTVQELQQYAINELAACHCTGAEGTYVLRNAFGDAFKAVHVGVVLEYMSQ